jgi:Uma2 family endonuclease
MPAPTTEIVYPESDGAPLGENTLQVQWIIALMLGLERHFQDHPDVFVAADLFWYPEEGKPEIVTAPDVMVAFGRPKGQRPSYKQWEEGGVAPQVAFEVLSPSNRPAERKRLARFYTRFGVEEFYEYDPQTRVFTVRLRAGRGLAPAVPGDGFTSPRLGVRFEAPPGDELRIVGPDGTPFPRYAELIGEAAALREAAAAREKAARLAARLRELGVDPDTV